MSGEEALSAAGELELPLESQGWAAFHRRGISSIEAM